MLATQGANVNQEQMMRMLMQQQQQQQQQQQRDGQQSQKVTVWETLPSLPLQSRDTNVLGLTGICLILNCPPAASGLRKRLHMCWIFLAQDLQSSSLPSQMAVQV